MPLDRHPVPGLKFPLAYTQEGRWVHHSYVNSANGWNCEWCGENLERHERAPYEPLCGSAPQSLADKVQKKLAEQAEFEQKYATNLRHARHFWTKPL